MATSNAFTSKTVYFFLRHLPSGLSLFGMDILMPPKDDDDWVVQSPRLLHYIPPINNRNNMGCGKLGSKLYILGGVSWPDNFEGEPVIEYPTDVQVFNPAAPEKLTKVSPMNSGKYCPVMFEVNEKLYVLGSRESLYSVNRTLYNVDPVGLNMFEEYDPNTDQWTVLEDPPVGPFSERDDGCYLWDYSCVVNSSTVVVQGSIPSTLFIFNTEARKWSKLEYSGLFYVGLNPLIVKDFFYAADGGGYFFKSGPLFLPSVNGHDVVDNLPRYIPTIHMGKYESVSMPYLGGGIATDPIICHLGDWRFCLLETSFVFSDSGYDLSRLWFNVFIHKVVDHDERSFRADCLYAATFTVKTSFTDSVRFASCHVMSNYTRTGQDGNRGEIEDSKRQKI